MLTFGCVISEELAHTNYAYYLGWIDALGILNSSGNEPEIRPFSHHSANTFIPLSMPVAELVGRVTRAGERPRSRYSASATSMMISLRTRNVCGLDPVTSLISERENCMAAKLRMPATSIHARRLCRSCGRNGWDPSQTSAVERVQTLRSSSLWKSVLRLRDEQGLLQSRWPAALLVRSGTSPRGTFRRECGDARCGRTADCCGSDNSEDLSPDERRHGELTEFEHHAVTRICSRCHEEKYQQPSEHLRTAPREG